MFNRIKDFFAIGESPHLKAKRERAYKILSREMLGIGGYPENPKVGECQSKIIKEIQTLPYPHNLTDVTIELSETMDCEFRVLEEERARYMVSTYGKEYLSLIKSGVAYCLFGYSVRVVPDSALDDKDFRIVYAPKTEQLSSILKSLTAIKDLL